MFEYFAVTDRISLSIPNVPTGTDGPEARPLY